MTLKRDELAADFMVQCEKGEPFECPHLADCPHEDKDLCLWQYEHADRIIDAHNAVIREIFEEIENTFKPSMPEGMRLHLSKEEWQILKQKYGCE